MFLHILIESTLPDFALGNSKRKCKLLWKNNLTNFNFSFYETQISIAKETTGQITLNAGCHASLSCCSNEIIQISL